ncbi:MAG: hypothetical protein ABIQ64_04330 [Candidatus Saccharimonadales bacterium]
MITENSSPSHEHPIGPVGISTPENVGTMPHRRLRFPSVHARDGFLSRAMEPLVGPTDTDFLLQEAPASGGEYDMFFRKGRNDLSMRAWTRDAEADANLDNFIARNLD